MSSICGTRVLIVEDNAMVGTVLADAIVREGGHAIGPAETERAAMDFIDRHPPGAAILDVHLDTTSFGIAARLRDLSVPFIFATGSSTDIPAEFRHVQVCHKPYTMSMLVRLLEGAIASSVH